MNTENAQNSNQNFICSSELNNFRVKTDQLMSDLENNDIESAMKCIHEINEINGKSFYSVIGMLTRGLHDAISDLSLSSEAEESENNQTRVDLKYVISLTDNAAKKTLDMTEKSSTSIQEITKNNTEQAALLDEYLANNSPDEQTLALIQGLSSLSQQNSSEITQVNKNIGEIVMAQNFQDLASQSITKAINIVKNVENSLVALTQYANLLTQLSHYTEQNEVSLNSEDSEEIKSNIGKLNSINENEHLDQNEVDDLLSSLGF